MKYFGKVKHRQPYTSLHFLMPVYFFLKCLSNMAQIPCWSGCSRKCAALTTPLHRRETCKMQMWRANLFRFAKTGSPHSQNTWQTSQTLRGGGCKCVTEALSLFKISISIHPSRLERPEMSRAQSLSHASRPT